MGRGLQLGSSTKGHVNGDPIADFARDLEDEMRMPITAGGDNPWGNDDLMDINATGVCLALFLLAQKWNNQSHAQVHLKRHRHQARHLHLDH